MRTKSLAWIVELLCVSLVFGLTGCTSILGDFQSGTGTGDSGSSDGTGGGQDASDSGSSEAAPQAFNVGGHVLGLTGTGLVLLNDGADPLPISSAGSFKFDEALANGESYDVTIQSQPTSPAQTCAVLKGTGKVAGADVTTVNVACTLDAYSISGSVSHLAPGDSVVLENNGGDDITVSANGVFTFKNKLLDGGKYAVSIKTQPSGSTDVCYIAAGTDSGKVAGADVTSVVVTCSDCGRFTTGFTGSWSTVAANPFGGGAGAGGIFLSDYLPPSVTSGTVGFYIFDAPAGTPVDAFISTSNSYMSIANSPVSLASYSSATFYANALWSMQGADVLKFDIATGIWSTPFTSLGAKANSQTTVDNAGHLWGYASESSLIEYDIATSTSSTVNLTTGLSGDEEPRIVYDGCSELLYIADYEATALYSYNPLSGTETPLSGLPGGINFQDGFCGDRSGHLFVIPDGAISYQYTIATDTWTPMPSTGPTGQENSMCGVGADGNLYAGDPYVSSTIYAIKLE